MAGADAQAGFYYQNIVAADYALDLIEFGSHLRSITLENPARATHIDDVIIDHERGATFVQVKWAKDETSSLTLHNLTTDGGDSLCLLAKLARGYRDIVREPGTKEIILLSTRRAGTNKQPASGFDKSLAEFISELHQPWIDSTNTSIQDLDRFAEYQSVLKNLHTASGLTTDEEFAAFLKCLRFRLAMPDRDTMADRVRSRLARLGIEQRYYAELLDDVVRWSIETTQVVADDVRTVLGVHDRFVDRVSHSFPVDRTVFVDTPDLFKQLDSSIQALDSGFILVEGEPGSGKSTALTVYLDDHPDVRFGYYCFVPGDTGLANERLGDDAFVRSLCIGLRNSFPDVDFPRPYAPHTTQLLNEWLHALSAAGRRTVFVVDGLDHVDRRTRQSLVAQPLTTVLAADQLPHGVLIVLSSRYPGALPQPILNHIRGDSRRQLSVPRFGLGQVREFLRVRGVVLSNELLDAATTRSGGVPIYLEYLADQLGELNSYEQKRYLQDVPSLRDQKIDAYHAHLWEFCEKDDSRVYLLAILAERDEFATPESLRDILRLLGIQTTLNAVHNDIRQIRHVLRVSDSKSVAIRHASLREFILERTSELRSEVTGAIVAWYEAHSDSDEAWRNQLRHLYDVGDYSRVAATCSLDWVSRAWAHHRPAHEIQHNLDMAWRAAGTARDLLEFIRIGLLKQQVAVTVRNLNLSNLSVARFLLVSGQPEMALRRVWDGERRRCSAVDFASFCLEHLAATGRPPAHHVVSAALGDEAPPGTGLDELRVWYRALSITSDDPAAEVRQVANLRWHISESHGHVTNPMDEDQSRLNNLDIQLAAIREIVVHGRIGVLVQLSADAEASPEVQAAALAGHHLQLAKAGDQAASETLNGFDVSLLPVEHQRWVILEAAAGGYGLPSGEDRTPPLPDGFLNGSSLELSHSLFGLYDALRCFFLRNETGFPWLETMVTSCSRPLKTLVLSMGNLATLWVRHVQGNGDEQTNLAKLKTIALKLDLPRTAFSDFDYRSDSAEYAYRQRADEFYAHVWSCAAVMLPEQELTQLAAWWASACGGELAARYPEATLNLATTLTARVSIDPGESVEARQLIELAEQTGRDYEEASAIGPALFRCASAWARCGFGSEAQRIWRELFDLACGIYWRKDYQFNEILTPLSLAHEQDPDGTLDRLTEQLTLAHQLQGTAQSKTVAVAIEELLEFIAEVKPALGLRGLVQEEPLIYRERALRRILSALRDDDRIERGLLVSLASTMGRWANYTEFDEQTNPAMFDLFSASLTNGDFATASVAYDIWRHVLLVEKQKPEELGRWAAHWMSMGGEAPERVQQDSIDYPPSAQEPPTEAGMHLPSDEEAEGLKLLDDAAGDISELKAALRAWLDAAMRRKRTRELDRVWSDWRDALGRSAKREWSEDDTIALDQCFDEFAKAALALEGETKAARREDLRQKLERLIGDATAKVLHADDNPPNLSAFFNHINFTKWSEAYLQAGVAPYPLQRELEGRVQQWIESAPYLQLAEWEDFCRHHADRELRATGLVKIAERCAKVDRDHAVDLLVEAWRGTSEFFHGHSRLARRLCELLLQLDVDRGAELLFESFQQQYQRYPESIVYDLDVLLGFKEHLEPFDQVELYNIWASHNRRLAAGLSEKAVDLTWLHSPVPDSFQEACFSYLLELLRYPAVDVRLLAADQLLQLIAARHELVGQALGAWPNLDDGQKELLATVLFSLGICKPASASEWAGTLVELAQAESHRNLRAIVAQAVQSADRLGAELDAAVLDGAQRLVATSKIIRARPSSLLREMTVWIPPYLRWSLSVLDRVCPSQALRAAVQRELAALYADPAGGREAEAAVHRAYNINANYDVIEISGPFDRAVRASLNRAVQTLVDSHDVAVEDVGAVENVLRVRDPSDALVRRIQRPIAVSWNERAQPEDEFLGFRDLDTRVGDYPGRDGEWLTLFEYTEHRSGDRYRGLQRATVAQVVAFGIARGQPVPTATEMSNASKSVVRRIPNLYRFELAEKRPSQNTGRFRPLVVATSRTFRGRSTPDMASFDPVLAGVLGLTRSDKDLLGFVNAAGNRVVRSIEWQEAFDQDRRRHEPRSVGFALQILRSELHRLADAENIDIWAWGTFRRTTDRDQPELKMDWRKDAKLFPLLLQSHGHSNDM